MDNFVWQCKCGHIEHQSELPEDCPDCLRVGNFKRVPEDQIEEAVEGAVLSMKPDEGDDADELGEYE